ncbi:hypothetical protein Sarmat_00580 [Rickettsiales endosymbiont of Paramecium tredecaurelia]|uniref:hypothetical protein n=1 Tax=Candidatus Sarmatiella mevalonica TaxID=2770581 RepID=UPI001922A417|nr:hypothetical protein [Candidatus Sarmatiella mevalonica]MBL3284725.1 hypothetical protein [Candidatus Sarmatiella mevalonica]
MSVNVNAAIKTRSEFMRKVNRKYDELRTGKRNIASDPNAIVSAQGMKVNGGILEQFNQNIEYIKQSIDGSQNSLLRAKDALDSGRDLTSRAVRNQNKREIQELQNGIRSKMLQAFHDLSGAEIASQKIFTGQCAQPLTQEQCKKTGVPQGSKPLSLFLTPSFDRALNFYEVRLLPGNGLQSDVRINEAFDPILPISVVGRIDVSEADTKRDLSFIGHLQSVAADVTRDQIKAGVTEALPVLQVIYEAYTNVAQDGANDSALRQFALIASDTVRGLITQYENGELNHVNSPQLAGSCSAHLMTQAILAKQDTINFSAADLMSKMNGLPLGATAQDAAAFVKNLKLLKSYKGQEELLSQFVGVEAQVLGSLAPGQDTAADYFAALTRYVFDISHQPAAQCMAQMVKLLPLNAAISAPDGANAADAPAVKANALAYYDQLIADATDEKTRLMFEAARAAVDDIAEADLDADIVIAASQLLTVGFAAAIDASDLDHNVKHVLSVVAQVVVDNAGNAENAHDAVADLALGENANAHRTSMLAKAKAVVLAADANASDYLRDILRARGVGVGAPGAYRGEVFDGLQNIATAPGNWGADRDEAKAAVRAEYQAIVNDPLTHGTAKRIAQDAINAIDAMVFSADINSPELGGNYSIRTALLGTLENSGLSKDAVKVFRTAFASVNFAEDCNTNKGLIGDAIDEIANPTAEQQAIIAAIKTVASTGGDAEDLHGQLLAILTDAAVIAACNVQVTNVTNSSGIGSNLSQRGIAGSTLAMMHITKAIGANADNWFELRNLKRASIEDPAFYGDEAMVREYNFVLDQTRQGVYEAGITDIPSANPTAAELERWRGAIAAGLEQMSFAMAIVSAGSIDADPAGFAKAILHASDALAVKIIEWGDRSAALDSIQVQISDESRSIMELSSSVLDIDAVEVTDDINHYNALISQTDAVIAMRKKNEQAIQDLIQQLTR